MQKQRSPKKKTTLPQKATNAPKKENNAPQSKQNSLTPNEFFVWGNLFLKLTYLQAIKPIR